jgi:hypothetical protein
VSAATGAQPLFSVLDVEKAYEVGRAPPARRFARGEPRLLHGVVGLQLVQPLGRFLLFPREAQRGAARSARREAAPLSEQLLLGFAAEVGPVCGVVSGFSHACL